MTLFLIDQSHPQAGENDQDSSHTSCHQRKRQPNEMGLDEDKVGFVRLLDLDGHESHASLSARLTQ